MPRFPRLIALSLPIAVAASAQAQTPTEEIVAGDLRQIRTEFDNARQNPIQLSSDGGCQLTVGKKMKAVSHEKRDCTVNAYGTGDQDTPVINRPTQDDPNYRSALNLPQPSWFIGKKFQQLTVRKQDVEPMALPLFHYTSTVVTETLDSRPDPPSKVELSPPPSTLDTRTEDATLDLKNLKKSDIHIVAITGRWCHGTEYEYNCGTRPSSPEAFRIELQPPGATAQTIGIVIGRDSARRVLDLYGEAIDAMQQAPAP